MKMFDGMVIDFGISAEAIQKMKENPDWQKEVIQANAQAIGAATAGVEGRAVDESLVPLSGGLPNAQQKPIPAQSKAAGLGIIEKIALGVMVAALGYLGYKRLKG